LSIEAPGQPAAPIFRDIFFFCILWPMGRVNVVSHFVVENLAHNKVTKHWGSV